MLKKYSQVLQAVLFLADMAIVSLTWLFAYFLRFYAGPIPVIKGIPHIQEFVILLLFLLPVFAVILRRSGLYEPMRVGLFTRELRKIITASCIATLLFTTVVYLVREYKYSRLVFVYFLLLNIFGLSLFRYSLRSFLRWFRSRGHNLRYVLIVGDGRIAQEVEHKITSHAEYGFKVVGFLGKDEEGVGRHIRGVPVLGTYKDLKTLLGRMSVDQLLIALPFEQVRMLRPILGQVYDEMVEVKIVPDLYEYFTLRSGIEEFDGLTIISLRESPLYGWNKLLKRTFDFFISLLIISASSPLLLMLAAAIKLTSAGPVFYRQERMGLDGRKFNILKFRSMYAWAESASGPQRTHKNDPRRTSIGRLMRRLNLDELPQFINVLKGDMSIVGPRPEREVFLKEFRKMIPEYMLRHKMKAGITGWAQVNGLRGESGTIEERTKYDLFYIENWSFLFDLKIFLKSFFAIKNAY